MNIQDATLQVAIQEINLTPDNHTAKLVLGDYLDDQGDHDAAHLFRWLGYRKKWPGTRHPPARKYWVWWDVRCSPTALVSSRIYCDRPGTVERSTVPSLLMFAMARTNLHSYHDTVWEALSALNRGLTRLRIVHQFQPPQEPPQEP